MTRLLCLPLLLLCLTILAAGQSSARDDGAIKRAVRQLVDAQIAFDAKQLDSLFTSDYVEISPLGELDPRSKVIGFYAPEKKPPQSISVSVEDTEYSIRNYGKYAVAIVRLNYSMTMEGKTAPPRSIRATFLMQKEKDSWKIASSQFTGIRAQQTLPK